MRALWIAIPASIANAVPPQSTHFQRRRFVPELTSTVITSFTGSKTRLPRLWAGKEGIGAFSVQQSVDFISFEAGSDGAAGAVSEIEMQKTLRLVECAMLASTAGLAYFLSNLFRFESYFGCFFPLPIVISAMRWGAAAGRKTMVTTALLLLVIAGPLKALSYVLMHGFLGVAMGALWRWRINWGVSILACTLVRAVGAIGFVFLSSWLIKENILNLITINTHASLSYMVAAMGINISLTMPTIYAVFTSLLIVNCASFVFLLHVLYAIILQGLGIKSSLAVPGWMSRSM
ncbi:uncharacterized protein LOC9662069 isoform X2 [Selaginella moellendorffii]|nr:uncharacterized protein LOC9662069 isoform X2 [Selaginella moellendorffii]|eukprot:XP_002982830.2 uncharacterized protein LOC9662069 isoform X2 [Selaginella moellendorffii]